MGTCYSINTFIYDQDRNNKCLICWECINTDNYVKCRICKIILHDYCALQIKHDNNSFITCPHCQRNGSLYIYFNDDCMRI